MLFSESVSIFNEVQLLSKEAAGKLLKKLETEVLVKYAVESHEPET